MPIGVDEYNETSGEDIVNRRSDRNSNGAIYMSKESIAILERALNFNYDILLIEDPVIDIDPWCTLANLNSFCQMCNELEKTLGIKLSITDRINNVT